MILGRAQNDSLGLLDFVPQTENVFRKLRFVILPVAEHKLIIAQVDEFCFALQFFGPLEGQRNRQRRVTAGAKASRDADDLARMILFVCGLHIRAL